MIDDHMFVEEIKNPDNRKMLYDITMGKINEIDNSISKLENQSQQIDSILNAELQEYEMSFKKNKERTISTSEFDKIDKNHKFRMNALNLKKISIKMKMDSQNNYKERLLCLCWLLKIPYGQDRIQVTQKDTDKKAVISKNDIYNKYFGYIIKGEKNRLENEQSFYRLQLDFNNIPNFPVDENHEFYGNNNIIKKNLENVKDELSTIQNSENQLNGNYNILISNNILLVEDFFNESSAQLFKQMVLGSNEDKIEQLFAKDEQMAEQNNGKKIA